MHMRETKIMKRGRLGGMALAAVLTLGGLGALGTVQAQEAVEGPSSVQETYRDWVVSCVTPQATEAAPAPARICEMRQELRQAEGNQRVLTMALQPAAEGTGATVTMIAPFGLLLSQPVTIDVAETRVADVPFRTCYPQGCVATAPLAQAAVDLIAAGAEAVVGMTSTDGQTLTLTVSLAGFTGAWNRLLDLQGG